ncbi:hypothetical protein BDM02DRAFT_3191413 [Thelephora ganbajun]|uniref:Uncharacterized protein n=1 Tax=Thelephora ganbajun TaxID=370292 RepID=A0ACB6Z1Q0_THEGA|nr:hypothetical protein BDM02DRAFT_3191413 [Thelephora ganbajun]
MTLENNCTFISPRNQRITHINTRPHMKNGKPTPDSYGFEYPSMSLLVNAVISQEDNKFPHCQYTSGCSFDDIIWQQAIGALKNNNHSCHSRSMVDDEKVLFDLVQVGIINHQEFDEPHKWSSHSICYSTVVMDHLWALYEAEHTRNNHLKADLNALKGEVSTQANALQLQNAALEQEVECLKQMVARLEGEFGVLLAQVEALEWTAPSEYLSVDDLLRMGAEGEVESMESSEVVEVGLCSNFKDLVDQPDSFDTTDPLFPY